MADVACQEIKQAWMDSRDIGLGAVLFVGGHWIKNMIDLCNFIRFSATAAFSSQSARRRLAALSFKKRRGVHTTKGQAS